MRRSLSRGDVVLIAFPFTDLSEARPRPAVIVGRPIGDDLVVAFLTTRPESLDPRAEHLLDVRDPEFGATGLHATSRIRAHKLATLHRELARRRLGRIGPRTTSALARCLRYVLQLE